VGQKRIDALVLKNISLHHLDILDVGDQFGGFDYIIAHGVYSWVPTHVRQKILAILEATAESARCELRQLQRASLFAHA